MYNSKNICLRCGGCSYPFRVCEECFKASSMMFKVKFMKHLSAQDEGTLSSGGIDLYKIIPIGEKLRCHHVMCMTEPRVSNKTNKTPWRYANMRPLYSINEVINMCRTAGVFEEKRLSQTRLSKEKFIKGLGGHNGNDIRIVFQTSENYYMIEGSWS